MFNEALKSVLWCVACEEQVIEGTTLQLMLPLAKRKDFATLKQALGRPSWGSPLWPRFRWGLHDDLGCALPWVFIPCHRCPLVREEVKQRHMSQADPNKGVSSTMEFTLVFLRFVCGWPVPGLRDQDQIFFLCAAKKIGTWRCVLFPKNKQVNVWFLMRACWSNGPQLMEMPQLGHWDARPRGSLLDSLSWLSPAAGPSSCLIQASEILASQASAKATAMLSWCSCVY